MLNVLRYLFIISILCSCSRCPDLENLPGRRPEVIVYESDCVLDYDTCCQFEKDPSFLDCDMEIVPIDPDPLTPQEYVFSIGDTLDIGVFGDDETLVHDTVIAPDGNIYYLFLDATKAAGVSVTELADSIAKQLGSYYVKPMVSIVPTSALNRYFRILGRVNFPGVYPLSEPKRLRDAIADAGGPITTYYQDSNRSDIYNLADLKRSFLIRNNRKVDVDFESLVYSPDDESNIPLLPGDYIYIAAAEHLYIYVLGNVQNPQRISYTKGLTVMGCLAIAGGWPMGFPYAADPSKLLVIRGSLQCPCVMHVDLDLVNAGIARDLYVQPGDIIFSADKTVRFGRELVRLAISTFLQSFASSAASFYGNNRWFD